MHWLSQLESEIASKLQSLHLDAIVSANFDMWIDKRSEIEIVDMILQLNQKAVSLPLIR